VRDVQRILLGMAAVEVLVNDGNPCHLHSMYVADIRDSAVVDWPWQMEVVVPLLLQTEPPLTALVCCQCSSYCSSAFVLVLPQLQLLPVGFAWICASVVAAAVAVVAAGGVPPLCAPVLVRAFVVQQMPCVAYFGDVSAAAVVVVNVQHVADVAVEYAVHVVNAEGVVHAMDAAAVMRVVSVETSHDVLVAFDSD